MSNLVHPDAEMYLAVLSHLPDAIVVVNRQGQTLFCNEQAKKLFHDRLEGLWLADSTLPYQILDSHRRPLGAAELPLQRVVAGHDLHDEELILASTQAPQLLWLSVSGGPCSFGPAGAMIAVRDISARKRGETNLLQQALHDELTRLPNRSLFLERVSQALDQSKEHQGENQGLPMAILFIDLDRFKVVNDNLGHQVGNQLLAQLGDRLRSCIRPEDIAARLGGDEFAILLQNIGSPDSPVNAMAVAETVAGRQLPRPFHLPPHDIYI
ncbi:MAG: GGDEF domain-containing protein [Leptolyngbyaceae cyanobacterium SM2_3_12]|nr:GGDEF domain-containing protein [Leptolyngbyaceae cyanobacterium SM2_3_12]